MIASGEATLGIFPKSEIVSVPGIALAGPLPAELQLTIIYGAGVTAGARSPRRRRSSSLPDRAGQPQGVDRVRV